MRSLALFALLLSCGLSEAEPWPLIKDQVAYSATVNGTQFKVHFSTGAFDKKNHKITPLKMLTEDSYEPPKIDGHTAIGIDGDLPDATQKYPQLTRLAVSFGEKTVEAPKELISHVLFPHADTTFNDGFQSGRVAISSDGKAVTIELSVGDGAAAGWVAYTFTADGGCQLGLPEPPEP